MAPSDLLLEEMKGDVTVGQFHDAHDRAHKAEKLLRKGVRNVSVEELRSALAGLQAGQRMTDAEDGPDAMFAADYTTLIRRVKRELERREK